MIFAISECVAPAEGDWFSGSPLPGATGLVGRPCRGRLFQSTQSRSASVPHLNKRDPLEQA